MNQENKNNTTSSTLSDFIDKTYGEVGTDTRDTFEKGYESFKLGVLIQETRIKKGYTQEQLAEKIGMDKSYISKIENNVKDIRLSTLQKIIEGLGGHLSLSISL